MGRIFFRKQFKKLREHQHELESVLFCFFFFPGKLAITLPATYLNELTLELIKEFDITHIFAMAYGIMQLNYIN